ncbi:MAG: ferrochelatase [Actinobacteria bacterium]|jgi:ferrochelatase|nr:ferrochelatase [Actinomycetota bacterium]NBP52810.1 ferrochelatase [Actinomycetota bacterium]
MISVVLMAYGTPRSREEILPYYTDIRRGRPPTDELLAELTGRYEAIGGLSPLAALTEAQRDAVQHALDSFQPGRFRVTLGLKHAHPMIEEAVANVANVGVEKIVGLVLAPHYSSYSIGQYVGRATTAAEPNGIEVIGIDSWATEPAFITFLADDMRSRLAKMPPKTKVLFTAHSLPQRIIDAGDPYPQELRATAVAVAEAVGLREGEQWAIAWQSAGRTPEPWIGPDVLDAIDALAASENPPGGVLVCACGFVADHLEVLFDLDIEAKKHAEARGLVFDRTTCVNDNPEVMAALARRIIEAAG